MMVGMIIGAALVFAMTTPAAAQYTCKEVRQAHATYGMAQLKQWAREHRITSEQQRAALRCIHRKRIVKQRRSAPNKPRSFRD